MIEFRCGDIAHISNSTRVSGMTNPGADTEEEAGIRRLRLRYGEACTIVKVRPSRDAYAVKCTGGAVYDVTLERDGQLYYVEGLPQNIFCSKRVWEEEQRLRREIARLQQGREEDE